MAEYRIKDLMEVSGTTERAIRQLFNTNEELKELKKEHSIKRQTTIYYDEVIYEWFVIHYNFKKEPLTANSVPREVNETEKSENPNIYPPLVAENKRLIVELKETKDKLQALQADYEKAEGERVELLRQNGLKTEEINHLLLLLSQEKAEKQALLPPPQQQRRSIGERIKGLFHKERDTIA
jgi:hypothetical protein